jgi:hypothetical protein
MRTAAAVANTRNRERDGDTVEEYGRPHLLATERLSPPKPVIIGSSERLPALGIIGTAARQ